jgi:membrane-bound lytic murein transglycosylase A
MKAGRRLSHRKAGLAAGAALLTFAVLAAGRTEAGAAVKFPNAQLEPIAWDKLDGWAADDHAAAFTAFMASCKAILRGTPAQRAARPVYGALYEACLRAVAAKPKDAAEARAYFEQSFRPVRISPLGETDGFLTGYYEPIVPGARQPSEEYSSPLYRKPPNLLKGGRMLAVTFAGKRAAKAKGKGKARRAGRSVMQYHDRTAIENGVLNGRNLEICYLKDPIDSFFIHIQGSARVRLEDGTMLRVNYEAQNGHPYTAVGKFLIERKIVTREEMSMDRIRQWMAANPDEGRELRRLNKSYVFFRETGLADNEEAIGAQGVSLTPGRSIAVDRKIHVYGTPFFITANLPIDSETPTTKFARLMIAQDTGGAIIGPARADIYFGAGDEAGLISGRLKNPGKFVMLFPAEIDPVTGSTDVPLPRPRPAIVPQAEVSASTPAVAEVATKPSVKQAQAEVQVTPLPRPKPKLAAKPKTVDKPKALHEPQ